MSATLKTTPFKNKYTHFAAVQTDVSYAIIYAQNKAELPEIEDVVI